MLYNSLVVSITNKCNASCKFCGISAINSNKFGDFMSIDILEKLCKESSKLANFQNIIFTGGEPFLYIDRVESVMYMLKTAKKNIGIVTNGFIFKNEETAKKIISRLSRNGLNFLQISTDQYHLEYINLNTIKKAILICKQYGISIILKIGMQYFDNTYAKIIEGLSENIFDISVQFYPIMPIGRAALLNEKNFYSRPISKLDMMCKHSTNMFVDEKGEIYPCCFFARPALMSLGNIKNTSLKEALSIARTNIYYKEIYIHGFNKLIENFINNNVIRLDDKYVDTCHLCNDIFGSTKYRKALESYFSVTNR